MVATPANNDYPILDGIAPSWADVVVRISAVGLPVLETKDIKSLNSSRSVELGEKRVGGRVHKRTSGSGKQEASITLYKEGEQKLYRELAKVAPTRGNIALIRYVHFGVNVMYTPPGSVEIFEKRWKGCCIIGDTDNGSEGTDANVVDIPLSVIEIVNVIDGKEIALI
jgi:hypothetical protein